MEVGGEAANKSNGFKGADLVTVAEEERGCAAPAIADSKGLVAADGPEIPEVVEVRRFESVEVELNPGNGLVRVESVDTSEVLEEEVPAE